MTDLAIVFLFIFGIMCHFRSKWGWGTLCIAIAVVMFCGRVLAQDTVEATVYLPNAPSSSSRTSSSFRTRTITQTDESPYQPYQPYQPGDSHVIGWHVVQFPDKSQAKRSYWAIRTRNDPPFKQPFRDPVWIGMHITYPLVGAYDDHHTHQARENYPDTLIPAVAIAGFDYLIARFVCRPMGLVGAGWGIQHHAIDAAKGQ